MCQALDVASEIVGSCRVVISSGATDLVGFVLVGFAAEMHVEAAREVVVAAEASWGWGCCRGLYDSELGFRDRDRGGIGAGRGDRCSTWSSICQPSEHELKSGVLKHKRSQESGMTLEEKSLANTVNR